MGDSQVGWESLHQEVSQDLKVASFDLGQRHQGEVEVLFQDQAWVVRAYMKAPALRAHQGQRRMSEVGTWGLA